tara:strand:- start:45 stop:1028 length:984 start_codon:yes stop_codon:yes gene_type:complete
MGNSDLMSRYGSGETNDAYDAVINTELTNYFDVVRETVYDPNLKKYVTRESQRNVPPAVRKAIDQRREQGKSYPVIAGFNSQAAGTSQDAGASQAASQSFPPEGTDLVAGLTPPGGTNLESVITPAAGTPPAVLSRQQVLDLIKLPSTPINVLEDLDAIKAFGLGSAAKDFANRIVGLGNGTMFPDTQESITALEGLNSRFAAAVLASLDGKDSVFQSQRVSETLPKPRSILTSTDRARSQAKSTVATINKGLQILESELLDLQTPLTEADVAKKTRQIKSLLGFRYAYEQIAKDPSSSSGSTDIIKERIKSRKEAAAAAAAAAEQN